MYNDTDNLARLIDEKLQCARQLRELGHSQLERIELGDFAGLMRILAGKQRLLGVLQSVEKGLDPFRLQAPDARHWKNAAARERCAAAARQCELLLDEVMAQEKLSERRLALQRDEAAVRLQGTHGTSLALGAYLAPADVGASQLNLVSGS